MWLLLRLLRLRTGPLLLRRMRLHLRGPLCHRLLRRPRQRRGLDRLRMRDWSLYRGWHVRPRSSRGPQRIVQDRLRHVGGVARVQQSLERRLLWLRRTLWLLLRLLLWLLLLLLLLPLRRLLPGRGSMLPRRRRLRLLFRSRRRGGHGVRISMFLLDAGCLARRLRGHSSPLRGAQGAA